MTKLIEFKHVQKKYDGKYVIDDLNLAIKKGEIFVLVGPSGSGKTTTLKMINGLSKPSAGDIYFKGKSLNEYNLQKMRWNMGYVLQQIALFPTMTVKQNIEVIPEMLGWEKQKRADRVDELLQKLAYLLIFIEIVCLESCLEENSNGSGSSELLLQAQM